MSSTVFTPSRASTDCQSFTFELGGKTHVVAGITAKEIPALVELVMNAQAGYEVAKNILMDLAGNTEVALDQRQELLERLAGVGFKYAKLELEKQKTGECVMQRAKEMGLLK